MCRDTSIFSSIAVQRYIDALDAAMPSRCLGGCSFSLLFDMQGQRGRYPRSHRARYPSLPPAAVPGMRSFLVVPFVCRFLHLLNVRVEFLTEPAHTALR